MALTTSAPPDVDHGEAQALFEEARRRRRRRRTLSALCVVAFATAVIGVVEVSRTPNVPTLGGPKHTSHAEPAPATAPAPIATCSASQLQAQYRGSQGEAGNWVSAFWIANTAASPCALKSNVTVTLLDAQGHGMSAGHALASSLRLSASATLPPTGQNPARGQVLAVVLVGWMTQPNEIASRGGTGTVCPDPLFEPKTAQIAFTGVAPLNVTQLTSAAVVPSGSMGSICGHDLYVGDVSPLTAPSFG